MKGIDLFAGAGGLSTGAEAAGVEVLWAANHWPAACDIYRRNHPKTIVSCQDLQQADFTQVPSHDILLASPACQGHSPARGKERPHHDALRSTAWAVIDAMECHRPDYGVVENVVDFMKWDLYCIWVAALQKLGYAVSPHIINAADHGAPQERERVFIVLTKSAAPLKLQLPRRKARTAREVIDFGAGAWRLVADKVPNTQARVTRGREQFGERFVMPYYKSGSGLTGRSLDRPIGTITTKNRWGVVNGPYVRMLLKDETREFMGFPRDYILPEGVTEATFMLGNGVYPQVITDVVNCIKEQA